MQKLGMAEFYLVASDCCCAVWVAVMTQTGAFINSNICTSTSQNVTHERSLFFFYSTVTSSV